jgi:hypothetical protein
VDVTVLRWLLEVSFDRRNIRERVQHREWRRRVDCPGRILPKV